MLGALMVFLYLAVKWLLGASLAQAAMPAFAFLWRWYLLWAALMGIYGAYTIVVATLKYADGCLDLIFRAAISTLFVSVIWAVHYGALLWGAHILLGLTTSFNWWSMTGAMVLILIGCLMQLAEWVFSQSLTHA